MNKLIDDALKYDLNSLINLQEKRKKNIILFEQTIKKEREAISQEEIIQNTLENKIKMHDSGILKLDKTEYYLIFLDLPKIKSTRDNRNKTIMLLKNAIIEEQTSIDYEERMIAFLESHGNKK